MRLAKATVAREKLKRNRYEIQDMAAVHTEAQLVDTVGALGQHLHGHLLVQSRVAARKL